MAGFSVVLCFFHLIQRWFFPLRLVGGQELSVLRQDVPFEGAVLGRPVGALGAGVGASPPCGSAGAASGSTLC